MHTFASLNLNKRSFKKYDYKKSNSEQIKNRCGSKKIDF